MLTGENIHLHHAHTLYVYRSVFTISFHAYNIGHLSSRASNPLFSPCTPSGVIALIDSTGVPISGKRVVVLGRSDIVGSPVAAMLRRRDATVTQCHSRTTGLQDIVSANQRHFGEVVNIYSFSTMSDS